MTTLQETVFKTACSSLDEKFPGKETPVCTDLFYNGRELSTDAKIEAMGVEEAASKLVDDTLYWMGYFTGTPGQ